MNSEATTKHALVSISSFVVLFALVFISIYWLDNIFANPAKYIGDIGLNLAGLIAIKILLIVSSVLISYIIYLLLSAKTRAILEAERMSKSIYASLKQLNTIYEESPVPYMTLDKDGRIIDPNKATLRFFGVTPPEIESKNIFDLIPEDEAEKAQKLLLYYKSSLAINMEELRMITKSGKIRWALLSIFKMEGKTNGKRAGLATIFDITERKELDKAKTEFVSLASHQLRTPAATIKWYIDTVLSGDLGQCSPRQNEYLERVQKVNEGMIDIVETLLNISRVEIGSINIDAKEVSVPQIVDSILLELSAGIDTKKLNVVKDYNGYMVSTKTDPKLLRIVIQNLISNAIKYTPENGTVKISLLELPGERRISVSDTGIGIPEADKEKIFTKLFRAENARLQSEGQGTGLGLYLVKSIIESMGGNIGFTSEVNKGSVFSIKF